MTFRQSVRENLSAKYLFVFRGRASRSEFWWFALFIILVNIACAIAMQVLPPTFAATLSLAVSLILLPPNIGVTVRRLHDRNLRGWWLLAPIGTLFLSIISGGVATASLAANLLSLALCLCYLAILCMPSQAGENRFGPQPQDAAIF